MLETLNSLPNKPGVYQYFDKNGRLLYVGKAKDLRKRVRSYFNFSPYLKANSKLSPRITKMIEESNSLNYILLDKQSEALILENSLIKQLRPKYNILLRDDKTYPYIKIDFNEDFPRLELVRRVTKEKNVKYLGPFTNGLKTILSCIYDLFALVQKKSCIKSNKACIYYEMKRCKAPCEGKITKEEYKKILNTALEHLYNNKLLISKIGLKMQEYSSALRFEDAAYLRDCIKNIESLNINSLVDLADNSDYDIFCLGKNNKRAIMLKMFIRSGKLMSSSHLEFFANLDENEIYTRTILDFYINKAPLSVNTILIADDFIDRLDLQELLRDKFSKKLNIICPKIGIKKNLIKIALSNVNEILRIDENKYDIKREIKEFFSLEAFPIKIECIDNSHLRGKACVSGIITYLNDKFFKESYRHYKLNSKNEYEQMKEALIKRVENFSKDSPPDLLVLDGGKTLLNLALKIFDSYGVNIDIIAISKEKVDFKTKRSKGGAKDIIYTKEREFILNQSDKKLQFIQVLRDEAHRFALSFHKKIRAKEDRQSRLLNIKGIGNAKLKKLIDYFGTFENIYKAKEEDLSFVLNKRDAKIILECGK